MSRGRARAAGRRPSKTPSGSVPPHPPAARAGNAATRRAAGQANAAPGTRDARQGADLFSRAHGVQPAPGRRPAGIMRRARAEAGRQRGLACARFFSENAGGGSPGPRAKARPRILAATRPGASRAVRRGGGPEGPGRRQSIPQGEARTRRARVVAPGIAPSWEPALGRPSQGRVARRAIRLYDLGQSIEP